MKKRKRAAAFLLAAAMALSLSGCGMFNTKLAKAIQKMSNLDDLRFQLSLTAELELRAAGQTQGETETEPDPRSLPLQGSFEAEGELYTKPPRAKMNTDLRLPGARTEQEIYLEKEENAYYIYSRLNDGTLWQKQGIAEQSQAKVKGIRYVVNCLESFEAAGEEELNGRKTSRFDGVIAGENLTELMSVYAVGELLTDGMGLRLSEGLLEAWDDVPATIWLDEGTGMIVRVDADLTALASTIASRQLEDSRNALGLDSLGLELALTGLRLRVELSQFNEAEDFSVPEEAKAAWGDSVKPWEK